MLPKKGREHIVLSKDTTEKCNTAKNIGCYFTLFYVFYGCPLDEISGFCALQWQEEVDEISGNRKYKLANFER